MRHNHPGHMKTKGNEMHGSTNMFPTTIDIKGY